MQEALIADYRACQSITLPLSRERNHPLDRYDHMKLYKKLRFRGIDIFELRDLTAAETELSN